MTDLTSIKEAPTLDLLLDRTGNDMELLHSLMVAESRKWYLAERDGDEYMVQNPALMTYQLWRMTIEEYNKNPRPTLKRARPRKLKRSKKREDWPDDNVSRFPSTGTKV